MGLRYFFVWFASSHIPQHLFGEIHSEPREHTPIFQIVVHFPNIYGFFLPSSFQIYLEAIFTGFITYEAQQFGLVRLHTWFKIAADVPWSPGTVLHALCLTWLSLQKNSESKCYSGRSNRTSPLACELATYNNFKGIWASNVPHCFDELTIFPLINREQFQLHGIFSFIHYNVVLSWMYG